MADRNVTGMVDDAYQAQSQLNRDLSAFIEATADELAELMVRNYAHQNGPRGLTHARAVREIDEDARRLTTMVCEIAQHRAYRRIVTNRRALGIENDGVDS